MHQMLLSKILAATIIFALTIFNGGCTKEKAEALKTSAKNFQAQSESALNKLGEMFVNDISHAPEPREEIIPQIMADLERGNSNGQITQAEIEAIIQNMTAQQDSDTKEYREKIQEIRNIYREFAGMYENLPRGRFFAKDAVARSEKLSIKLTLHLTNFAKYIDEYPFRLNARLQAARRKRDEAMRTANVELRNAQLRSVAEELINIKNETDEANRAVKIECLKGAELGLKVTKLIREYDKLSASDILELFKEALPAIGQLTGKDTAAIMKRVNEIQTTIETDEVWRTAAQEVQRLYQSRRNNNASTR